MQGQSSQEFLEEIQALMDKGSVVIRAQQAQNFQQLLRDNRDVFST